MAEQKGNSDRSKGYRPEPHLLALPQELRDGILSKALNGHGAIELGESKLGQGDRSAKQCHCRLALTCQKLHEDAQPIFFKDNTFQLCAHYDPPALSDEQCRLIDRLNIHITCLFDPEADVDELDALVKVRGATATTTPTVELSVDGNTWTISPIGLIANAPNDDDLADASDVFNRMLPSMEILYKAIASGGGIGIETLKEALYKIDLASVCY